MFSRKSVAMALGVMCVLVWGLSTAVQAADVLKVEFGGTFQGGDGDAAVENQSGWSSAQNQYESANPSWTFGSYTVAIRSDRPMGSNTDGVSFGGGVTLGNMYTDSIVVGAGGDGTTVYLDIEGLTADTEYEVTLWAFNNLNSAYGGQVDYALTYDNNTVISGTTQNDITNTGSAPADDDDYTIGWTATTTSTGKIHIRLSGMSGGWSVPIGFINGVRIATVTPPPTVTSVSPDNGPASGGTSVTITGSDFQSGATVTFGGTSATGVTVDNSTQISCTTPAHTAGDVDVVVTNPDDQYDTLTDGFTYNPAPTVTGVSPDNGTTAGGTSVTITGTNFVSGATVTFGGTAATGVTVNSATSITCTTPAHAAGDVNVVVTNADSQYGSLTDGYTYVAPAGEDILKVEFGGTYGGGDGDAAVENQSGWSSAQNQYESANPSWTFGSYTVKIRSDRPIGTNTDSVSFGGGVTLGNMYTDSIMVGCGGGGNTAYVDIEGLSANTEYVVTLWAFNNLNSAAGGAVDYALAYDNNTVIAGTTQSDINNTGSAPTSDSDYTIQWTATSTSTGKIHIYLSGMSGSWSAPIGFINGVKIRTTGGTPAPTVTTVSPNNGPASGGTSVTITGADFQDNATVTFGGTAATGVTVDNATQISCTTPAHAAGAVNVVVTNPDNQTGTKTSGFTYNPAPTVTGVSPDNGTTAGGTSVTVTGTNFVTGATVTFGGTSATGVTVVSGTSITCTTPAHAAGAVNVVVTNSDSQYGTLSSGFTYEAPGGEEVLKVDFGGDYMGVGHDGSNPSPAQSGWSDFNDIWDEYAYVKSHAYGSYTVGIDRNGVDSAVSGQHFDNTITFAGAVTLDEMYIDAAGVHNWGGLYGMGVTVQGLAASTAYSVEFWHWGGDGEGSGSASWYDNTSGSATLIGTFTTSNTHPTSDGDYKDTYEATTDATGKLRFVASSYSKFCLNGIRISTSGGTPAPTVSSVSPDCGTTAGGTSVGITGANFQSGATVKFGANSATGVTVDNATHISCTSPAGSAGAVNVEVKNPDNQTGTKTNGFTYHAAPTVTSLSPDNGTTGGGTSVTITGTGFWGAATVTFDGTSATGVTVVSATSITCTTPAHAAGDVDVVVTNPDSQYGTLTDGYNYYSTGSGPTVSTVTPDNGVLSGGTSITITGTNYASGATVKIGANSATGVTVNSSTSITCTTPASSYAGPWDVTVTNTDNQSGTKVGGFFYNPPPLIAPYWNGTPAVVPDNGPYTGGTNITIHGSGFVGTPTVTIGGASATNVSRVSKTVITCTTPAGTPGRKDVTVVSGDGQSATLAGGFLYVPADDNAVLKVEFGGIRDVLEGTYPVHYQPGWSSFQDVYEVTSPSKTFGSYGVNLLGGWFHGSHNYITFDGGISLGNMFCDYVRLANWDANPFIVEVTGLSNSHTYKVEVWSWDSWSSPSSSATFAWKQVADDNSVVTDLGTWETAGKKPVTDADYRHTFFLTTTSTGKLRLKGEKSTYFPPINGLRITDVASSTPVIKSIAPNNGVPSGGTSVTIVGQNLPTSSVTVTFGGTNATGVTVDNSTQIRCTTPSHAAGSVDVEILQSGNPVVKEASGFAYNPAPDIASIDPTGGPSSGGTAVYIRGDYFLEGATVTVGGNSATSVTRVRRDLITCTTPSGTVGARDVVVTNPDGQYDTLSGGFTYDNKPSVISVSPDNGPYDSTTNITITGGNFVTGATVQIGSKAATSVSVVNSTTITCTAEANNPGLKWVKVTNPDSQFATLKAGFMYNCLDNTQGAYTGGGMYGADNEPDLPDPMPAAGEKFVDPKFGATILRFTDESDGVRNYNYYYYWNAFNKDSTRVHVFLGGEDASCVLGFDPENFERTSYKRRLYVPATVEGSNPASEDATWSGIYADKMTTYTNNKFYYYSITDNAYTVIADFSAEGALPSYLSGCGMRQMCHSMDDNVFTFTLMDPGSGAYKAGVVYDRKAGGIVMIIDTENHDELGVSKDGTGVILKYGTGGDDMVYLPTNTITRITCGPWDWAPNHGNSESKFFIGGSRRYPYDKPHEWIGLASGGGDVSTYNDNEDWVSDDYGDEDMDGVEEVFNNEIYMRPTFWTPRNMARRICSTYRWDDGGYFSIPHNNIARDGKYILFNTNWQATDVPRVDVLIVKVPPVDGD